MAEPQQKRLRSEEAISISKRQKPNYDVVNILDDDEPSHELSAIFTSLQQELSSTDAFDLDSSPTAAEEDRKTGEDEDEGVRSVMRHLLEASDDELGIPNPDEFSGGIIIPDEGGFDLSEVVDNGIWELEDVAANYYTMLQSELLFM